MEKNLSLRARTVLVCLLTLFVAGQCRAQGNDIKWLRSINEHRNKSLDPAMNVLSESSYGISAFIPAEQLVYGYLSHNKAAVNRGWTEVVGLGVNLALTAGLKYTVNRARPFVTYPDIQPYQKDTDPSFPSSHASFAFCTATMLTLQCPKWYVIVPAYAWAGAVGYSRLWLGMHYPSDVAVGALVGAASAYVSYKGMQWLHHRHRENKMVKFKDEQNY